MRPETIEPIDATVEVPPRSRTAAALHDRLAGPACERPADRAERLLHVLEELQHSPAPVSDRYQSLRQCLSFASRLRTIPAPDPAAPSLPLPPDTIQLARRCADTYRLMADCFRRIADDIAAQDSGPLADVNRLSQACYWAITCLGDYLVIRRECFLKPGPGIWLDIHATYDLAVSEGVEQLPLGRKTSRDKSVESAYKRLLLLGLADSFQQPRHGVTHLYGQLKEWTPLVRLATASRPATRCLFVVDPRLDRPATPALSQAELRPELGQRWLSTRDLVTRLKQEYDAAVSRSTGSHDAQGPSSADELNSVEFLRRLIVHWGIYPVRSATRRKASRRCQLVSGVDNVCRALHGFRPLNGDSPEPEAVGRRTGTGPSRHAGAGLVGDLAVRNGWKIEDESETGFKLVCRPPGSYGVGVDDLVAVRSGGTSPWIVGTVHWAQTDESGNVALGVKRIAQPIRPVLIDRLRAGSEVTQSTALLLEDRPGSGMERALISPPSQYRPDAVYLVRQPSGRGELTIEAADVRLASRSFVWFTVIEPRAGTTQRVLDLIQPD